jgi:hypothetical protein
MTDKPRRVNLTPQNLIEFLKSLPAGKLQDIAARARDVSRAGREASCEDFYQKMDLLLPVHEGSLRETHLLLTRLRAGRPNLPLEGR